MDSIFARENEVLDRANSILKANIIQTNADKDLYENLVEEYEELLEQMQRMVRMSDMMENKLNSVRRSIDEISKIDFLTNIYNRRYFNEVLIEEWENCKKDKSFLAVIMIDVDKFKAYNDIYGHLNGDKCLQSVSEKIKNAMCNLNSVVARYGGEEFIVLIPNFSLDKAENAAENIRKSIEKLNIAHEGSEGYRIVTVSIGAAAEIPSEKLSPEKLVNIADEALYRAKKSGRNRISI